MASPGDSGSKGSSPSWLRLGRLPAVGGTGGVTWLGDGMGRVTVTWHPEHVGCDEVLPPGHPRAAVQVPPLTGSLPAPEMGKTLQNDHFFPKRPRWGTWDGTGAGGPTPWG